MRPLVHLTPADFLGKSYLGIGGGISARSQLLTVFQEGAIKQKLDTKKNGYAEYTD